MNGVFSLLGYLSWKPCLLQTLILNYRLIWYNGASNVKIEGIQP